MRNCSVGFRSLHHAQHLHVLEKHGDGESRFVEQKAHASQILRFIDVLGVDDLTRWRGSQIPELKTGHGQAMPPPDSKFLCRLADEPEGAAVIYSGLSSSAV
jgi:hypothetical protein